MANLRISDLYASRYLKSDDFSDTDMVLTIDNVEREVLGYGERREERAVVYFSDIDKVFVLNKTNANTIVHLYGDDTAKWHGKRIALYTTEVSYQGTQTMGIRVRMRPPGQTPGSSQIEEEPPDLWE